MKDEQKSVYFAHPYQTWKSEEEGRIERKLTDLGYIVYNAFNQIEEGFIEKYGGEYYSNPSKEFAEEIVNGDFLLLDKSDEYFGWFPKGHMCIGSSIELQYAYAQKKKISVICESPHPFLYTMSDKFYKTISDFENGREFRL